MGKILALDGNAAIAHGVMCSQVQLIAAYPITPQTPVVQTLSSLVDTGKFDAKYVNVESEHSAISCVVGASSAGVRTFTASASHGLALMHELTGLASASRLPIVMAVVSRAMPGPCALWCDHSDIMTQRDQGWIQLFAKSPQEALDFIMIAYKTSEDKRVLIPTMVDIDGFYCSHLTEPVNVPDNKEATEFIKAFEPNNINLDPATPYAVDNLSSPDIFTEQKLSQDIGMRAASEVLDENFEKFNRIFNRKYEKVMCYGTEDAETIVLCMGSMSGTALHVVKKLRSEGRKVGIARITTFRPFPSKEVAKALKNVKSVAVIDRVSGLGSNGPLYQEVVTTLHADNNDANTYGFVAGLGGRDIWEDTIVSVFDKTKELGDNGKNVWKPIWIDKKEG